MSKHEVSSTREANHHCPRRQLADQLLRCQGLRTDGLSAPMLRGNVHSHTAGVRLCATVQCAPS